MTQGFNLGFNIDTAGLKQAGMEATAAAEKITKLGDAEQKLTIQVNLTADALRKEKVAVNDNKQSKKELEDKAVTLTNKLREQEQHVRNLAGAFSGSQGLTGGLANAASSASALIGRLGPMALGFGAFGIAAGIVAKVTWDMAGALGAAQDKAAMLQARLTNSLGSVAAARESIRGLYEDTQKTGLGFDAAADAFARIARNNSAIGLTRQEMAQLVQTTQMLGAASGASMGEMQGGMIQFGQALASGRLQGDELRSIMESFPALAKSIAENFENADGSMGISIGTLRRMGSEGELTADKITAAILRGTAKAEEEYSKIPNTIERAEQRLADSYQSMLAKMGAYFDASGWKKGVLSWLSEVGVAIGNLIPETGEAAAETAKRNRFAELDKIVNWGSRERRTDGPMSMMIGALGPNDKQWQVGPGGLTQWDRRFGGTQAEQSEYARMLKEKNDLKNDEKITSLLATATGAESLAAQYESATAKTKRINQDIDRIDGAIANAKEALGMGGNKDNTPADIEKTIAKLQATRANAVTSLEKALQGDRSALSLMLQGMSDTAEGNRLGGGGGGTAIITQAISARRADNMAGKGGGPLADYISAGLDKAVDGAKAKLEELHRGITSTRDSMKTIGAGTREVMEAEAKRDAQAEKFRMAGTLSNKALEKWFEDYKKALIEHKQAANDAANAQAQFNAATGADRAEGMAGGALNGRAQGRMKLQYDLSDMARRYAGGVNDPGYAREAGDRTREFNANNAMADRQSVANLERQLDAQQKMAGLQRLSRDELRVQQALVQKKLDLEYEGLTVSDERYNRELRLTEAIERGAIAAAKGTAADRVTRSFEESFDRIEGVAENMWDDIFTNGLESGGEIFEEGMSDIITRLSAQMINEIAVKPFLEASKNMAMTFGQSIVSSIFGAPMQTFAGANTLPGGAIQLPLPSEAQTNLGNGYGVFAKGAVFQFAKGKSFTNGVYDTPQRFTFANGAALGEMAEAGPEAVMPLDRGADGKLGVNARGMGGGNMEVNIIDQRSGANSAPIETSEERGPNGQRILNVMIRDAVGKQFAGGEHDKTMRQSYSAQRTIGAI